MEAQLLRTVEVQLIETNCSSESSIGGSFMLKYGGINTKAIPYDANASQIKTRLEELPSISVGSIDTSSGTINPSTSARQWYVTFTGRYGDVAQLIEYDDVALTGNGAAVYIRETTKGVESKHISGSPFFINVLPNRAEPTTTIAYGEGLVGAIAGRVGTFTIQAKDVHGNNRMDSQPREVFQVDIFQPGAPPRYPFMSGEKIGAVARRTFINTQQPIHIMGNVSYIGNGAYEVVYYPEVSGRYTIAITMAMKHEIQTVKVGFDTQYGRQGTYTLNYGAGPGPCPLTSGPGVAHLISHSPPSPSVPGVLPCQGINTDPIAWDAAAVDVKNALEKLPTIGTVDVSRL